MARDRKRHANDKGLPTAPPVAVPVTLSAASITGQHREDFLALIRALAREAARLDHETALGKSPNSSQART